MTQDELERMQGVEPIALDIRLINRHQMVDWLVDQAGERSCAWTTMCLTNHNKLLVYILDPRLRFLFALAWSEWMWSDRSRH